MKTIVTIIMIALLPLCSFANNTNNEHNGDDDKGNQVSLWIPGFAFKIGSLFFNKQEDPEAKYVLSRMGSLRVIVKEDAKNFQSTAQYKRITRKLRKRNLEEFITVKDGSSNVSLKIREGKRNKSKIRNLVLLVEDEGDIVFIKARCNMDLKRLINFATESDIEGMDKLGGVVSSL